jgi:hypothetical protein
VSVENGVSDASATGSSDAVSRLAFEQLVHVRGEGDEWDFKETLGDLTETSVRVNLAKDVLAFCNLPSGGTIVIGVASDYERVGLGTDEHIDTTAIRNAVAKYVDGDFSVVAAEHILAEDGDSGGKRYGIVHFHRRSSQPVLAALDGQIINGKSPIFRSGDILIRRGAASIRAHSGDVRHLLTSSVVQEERVRAVNELWACLVEQRRPLSGVEFLYDVLLDTEYQDVFTDPNLGQALGSATQSGRALQMDAAHLRANLVRPHIPDSLYQRYRSCVAVVGRIQMKAIRQRDASIFVSWTQLDDGSPDSYLRDLMSLLLSPGDLDILWTGTQTDIGISRPLRPALDAAERLLLTDIGRVLNGIG